MKAITQFILLLLILGISSCKENGSISKDLKATEQNKDSIKETKPAQTTNKNVEEKVESVEKSKIAQRTYTEAEINKKYDSLIGKMPRMDIQPYLDSLQGKKYEWKIPENWKFKEQDALAMLQSWNTAHNNHDAKAIADLYSGDYHELYGKTYEYKELIALKENLFENYPDFKQKILTNSIKTEGTDVFIHRIEFKKVVIMNGKESTYNSFLEFGGTQGSAGINGEGDIN